MNYKKKSKKQEHRVAKEMGGKVTLASGALWFQKGDVKLDKFLIECKTTVNSYYKLHINVWEKISQEALKSGMRIPLMQIELNSGKNRLVVMNYLDFVGIGLDRFNFVTRKQPLLLEQKSYKITDELLKYEVGVDWSNDAEVVEKMRTQPYFTREDIKFVDYNTHLVFIKWSDFLYMIKEV